MSLFHRQYWWSVFLLGIFGLVVYLGVPTTVIAAEQETLKVATWNIFGIGPTGNCRDNDGSGWDEGARERIRNSVEAASRYIAEQKFDIILLQEVAHNCGLQPSDEAIAERLQQYGWPMDYYSVPDDWFSVTTYSRFPIDKQAAVIVPDYAPDPAREHLMVPIDTPLGRINVYNTHIRGYERDGPEGMGTHLCFGFTSLMNMMKADPYESKLLGADFNFTLDHGLQHFPCTRFPVAVEAFEYLEDNYVISNSSRDIDFLVLPKDGPLEFANSYHDPETPWSDHTAIIGELRRRVQCQPTVAARCSPDGSEITITSQFENTSFDYRNYVIRVNGNPGTPECQNAAGTEVDWYCPRDEGLGEDFIVNAEAGSSSVTVPVKPGLTYSIRSSIESQLCSSPEIQVRCNYSIVSPDYNNSGVVDIFDYSALVERFNTVACQYNLTGTDSCLIDIFDYSVLVAAFSAQ